MRILGRIVGVRSTEQFVGIKLVDIVEKQVISTKLS